MKNVLFVAFIATISLAAAASADASSIKANGKNAATANQGKTFKATSTKPSVIKKVKPKRRVPVIKLPPLMTQSVRQSDRRFFDKAVSSYRREFRRRGVKVDRRFVIQFPNGERKQLRAAKKHRKRMAKKSVNKEQAARNQSKAGASTGLARKGGGILKKPSRPSQVENGGWRRGQVGLPRGVQINLSKNTVKTFQATGKMRPTPRRKGG